jgi:AraC-like DNA-binding protein
MVDGRTFFQPPEIPERAGAWAWRHRPQFWRPRHHHAELEFNLVLAGCGTIGIGPRLYRVVARDLLWFLPGMDHVLLDASSDYDMWVVAYRPALVARVRDEQPVDPLAGIPEARAPVRLPPAAAAEIGGRCAALHGGHDPRGERLAEALVLASRCGPIETPADWHPCVHPAAKLLRVDPSLGREQLGAATRTSASLLAHRFRRALGMSIPEYRARIRLHAAMATLEAGERSLTQAALQSGFGSYAQFHRVVRSMTALAPRELISAEGRSSLLTRTARW